MKDIMTYLNYIATIHYSADDEVFFGRIEGINDLVSFEGESVSVLKTAFREAVDDYINTCLMNGKPPQKTYKGSFNVRISPELHQQAAYQALVEKVTLNQFIEQAIREKMNQGKELEE
jgi:predicted HicB family RNase H-like nuclease